MKDLFQEFRAQNAKRNITIVASAFVMAISVNSFLFGTDAGNKIQTSVLERGSTPTNAETVANLILKDSGSGASLLKLVNGSKIEKAREIRLSLAFDPTAISLKDPITTDKETEVTKISNIDGILLLNVRFKQERTIATATELLGLPYEKKHHGKTVVNLMETQFSDGKDLYELTNSPVEIQ